MGALFWTLLTAVIFKAQCFRNSICLWRIKPCEMQYQVEWCTVPVPSC